ncbi:hypothetical protein RUA4292_04045 [Ruegeria atlantica]|uniref:Uncharacterized protein n=1 Tax=Ruegeria atlantica TaxID=81569 RepID=A0A0P1F2G2_9RHOB|nr:hypothetical protein RUA4292_04045 [Ruegeria atlantica]
MRTRQMDALCISDFVNKYIASVAYDPLDNF